MMSEDAVRKVAEVYIRGNEAVLASNYEHAVHIFDEIADHLDLFESTSSIDYILKILSNRGFCHSKLRNDSAAVEDFTNLLDRIEIYRYFTDSVIASLPSSLEPSMILSWKNLEAKTLMRRAVSFESIGEFRKAQQDLSCLREQYSDVFHRTPSLQQQWIRIEHRLKEDSVAAKLDGRPGWMAHAHQSLRLSIIRSLPQHLRLGQPLTCRVALGNELGLFDRSLFLDKTLPLGFVQCEVFALSHSSSTHLPSLRLLSRQNAAYLASSSGISDDSATPCIMELREDGKATMHLVFTPASPSAEHFSAIDVFLRFSIIDDNSFSSSSVLAGKNVLSVVSIPITIQGQEGSAADVAEVAPAARTMFTALKKGITEMKINCIRPIPLPSFLEADAGDHPIVPALDKRKSEILCGESVGLLGIGGKIWDSTFVLIRYLYHHRSQFVTGKKLLELGAGTGITSLTLSRLQPDQIVCTDLAEVVPLIDVNVQLNAVWSPDLSIWLQTRFRAQSLTWGESLSLRGAEEPVDVEDVRCCQVIIASDVVYYPEGYAPLLHTLEELLAVCSSRDNDDGDTVSKKCCILAHRHRHPEDHRFFAMLAASPALRTEEISWQTELGMYEAPKSDATDAAHSAVHTATLQDVRMFRISAKKP